MIILKIICFILNWIYYNINYSKVYKAIEAINTHEESPKIFALKKIKKDTKEDGVNKYNKLLLLFYTIYFIIYLLFIYFI